MFIDTDIHTYTLCSTYNPAPGCRLEANKKQEQRQSTIDSSGLGEKALERICTHFIYNIQLLLFALKMCEKTWDTLELINRTQLLATKLYPSLWKVKQASATPRALLPACSHYGKMIYSTNKINNENTKYLKCKILYSICWHVSHIETWHILMFSCFLTTRYNVCSRHKNSLTSRMKKHQPAFQYFSFLMSKLNNILKTAWQWEVSPLFIVFHTT